MGLIFFTKLTPPTNASNLLRVLPMKYAVFLGIIKSSCNQEKAANWTLFCDIGAISLK